MLTLLAHGCVWVGVSSALGMLLVLALVAGVLLLKGGAARLVVLALSLAILAGCAARADGPVVVMPRPSAELRTASPIAAAPYAEFLFTLVLDEALACPGIGWDFGDGRRGYRESDCEPDELGPRVHQRWHVYRVPGHYTVRADVSHAGRTLTSATTTVIVTGFTGVAE